MISTVSALLDRLLAPLGGRDGDRTDVLVRELTLLIDTPLDPS